MHLNISDIVCEMAAILSRGRWFKIDMLTMIKDVISRLSKFTVKEDMISISWKNTQLLEDICWPRSTTFDLQVVKIQSKVKELKEDMNISCTSTVLLLDIPLCPY